VILIWKKKSKCRFQKYCRYIEWTWAYVVKRRIRLYHRGGYMI